jgi:hypothetical protein
MKTILEEFKGSTEHIKNNFYCGFLAINFVNQRPFQNDIILPAGLSNNIMKASSLNSFDKNGFTEYGNSIRRHFLNDMVIAYERYSMTMFVSHQNGKIRTEPATINNRNLGPYNFENLANIYDTTELTFLTQLRRLRNSIVHYNGLYSATNVLNYTFGTNVYNSSGNEGQNITVELDNILWIFDKLKGIVTSGNINYFNYHPII